MMQLILPRLDEQDDPELWRVAVDHIVAGLDKSPGLLVEVGRCSHWLRPHQTRWSADGGFAWPAGYGGRGYSRTGLPLFDWSVVLKWTGENWVLQDAPMKKGRGQRSH